MLKTALHLCRQHQTIHTMLLSWNTHDLVSAGAERMKPKMTLLSPTTANRHMPWFFFLPFRKLFNQSRPFRVQKLWFSERLKKRGGTQEREGERERVREGRRRKGETEVEGKRKEKGEKGRERKPCWVISETSLSLDLRANRLKPKAICFTDRGGLTS